MDEVDIDAFLREASEAVDDAQKLSEFIREKATIAIERFLVSFPMIVSIECNKQVEAVSHRNYIHRTTYQRCPYRSSSVILLMDGF